MNVPALIVITVFGVALVVIGALGLADRRPEARVLGALVLVLGLLACTFGGAGLGVETALR